MSPTRIDSTLAAVLVEPARTRQTARSEGGFGGVLAVGANVLLAGAEVVGGVMGGPVAALVVRGVRSLVGGLMASATGGSEMAQVQALQRESQAFSLQLLDLQREVQDENRRFTVMSHVLRASHDTARAAVSNIRS
jgi:hypothetical protein